LYGRVLAAVRDQRGMFHPSTAKFNHKLREEAVAPKTILLK
jgi:hypothetical protein